MSGPGPADHFRTSVHAAPLFAEAVLELARSTGLHTDRRHRQRAEASCCARCTNSTPPSGWSGSSSPSGRATCRRRSAGGPSCPVRSTDWSSATSGSTTCRSTSPIVSDQGWRLLLVDPATGDERPGDQVAGADLEWLERWWPAGDVGDRAEIGRPRDEAWADVVGSLSRGVAVAVDYHHQRTDRPRAGSLAGYRSGRRVAPVPDGTCDITSHVALDACAAAGEAAGADWTVLTDQRAMLQALLGATPPPPYDLATREPASYLAALSRASQAADLTRRDGLGGFGWLAPGRRRAETDPPSMITKDRSRAALRSFAIMKGCPANWPGR